MKFKSSIKLATRGILRHKKKTVKVLFIFITIFILLICFFSYVLLLNNNLNDILNEIKTNNVLLLRNKRLFYSNPINLEDLKNVKNVIYAEEYIYGPIQASPPYNIEFNGRVIDDKSYINLRLIDKEKDMDLLYGRSIVEKNEIIISDKLLYEWGYRDYEKLINGEFNIYFNNFLEEKDFNFILSGITREDDSQSLYMNKDLIPDVFEIASLLHHYQIEIDNFTNKDKVISEVEILFPRYYVTWSNDKTDKTMRILNQQRRMQMNVFLMVGIIIIGALLSTAIVIISIDIKNKQNYYGILLSMGAGKKDIYIINYLESLFITFISFLISLALSYIVIHYIEILMFNMTNLVFKMTFTNYITLSLIIFSAAITFNSIIAIITGRIIMKSNTLQLLKNEV